MVPWGAWSSPDHRSLPRARGDGPSPPRGASPWRTSPPRARGWSLDALDHPARFKVSPARAGMVPRVARCGSSTRRLPRARGDGPVRQPQQPLVALSPPRARGWSQLVNLLHDRRDVSPARAGMVPRPSARARRSRRLPRARGDGPLSVPCNVGSRKSPPRARGWSRRRRGTTEREQVSPARAGMVPAA